MAAEEEPRSLEYTSTWIVAGVSFIIILISLCAERGLHRLGKFLRRKGQDALFDALTKLKEELMLLGFISLLLTVSQGAISRICIPAHVASHMLPCKLKRESSHASNHERYSHQTFQNGRRLLSAVATSNHCAHQKKVPLLSLEALHQLHMLIFVLAVVHVIFCCITMLLGGAKIREWKRWETALTKVNNNHARHHHHRQFFKERAVGRWRKLAIISWIMSFFKQFYGSVTKSDYAALRQGFIMEHFPTNPTFDFHEYMMRTLGYDFKKVVGISWYLWLFVVLFLLLNVGGWHTYFWLAFLPLILLLLVGAKLEHIITRLAEEVGERIKPGQEAAEVKPSDEHFWFGRPRIVLYLIHFILFQNSFEIAFFFWILSTYGFKSCIIEKLGYIIPRLAIGLIVQVLCSYSTLPLYVLVTQMGNAFKTGIFEENVQEYLEGWVEDAKSNRGSSSRSIEPKGKELKLVKESFQGVLVAEHASIPISIAGDIHLNTPSS